MTESLVANSPVARLRAALESRARGRLVADVGGAVVRVYVDTGAIRGADATDDGHWLIRRLWMRGRLSEDAARDLQTAVAEQGGIAPIVDSARADDLDEALRDRFYDNLARFTYAPGPVDFEPLGAVIPANLQLVDDAEACLARCEDTGRRAALLPSETPVTLGHVDPANEREARIVMLLQTGPLRVEEVIDWLPEEPVAATALVGEMIDRGVLARVTERVSPLKPARERGLPSSPFLDLGAIAPEVLQPASSPPADRDRTAKATPRPGAQPAVPPLPAERGVGQAQGGGIGVAAAFVAVLLLGLIALTVFALL